MKMRKENFLLLLLFLLRSCLGAMAAQMAIEQNCWFLYTPGEKWHAGNILSVKPFFSQDSFQLDMKLKEIQLADSRGSRNERIEIEKFLFSFEIDEKKLAIGDLDLDFSPFILGRTEKEKRIYQLEDIKGSKISDLALLGADSTFYIGKEGENISYGTKISKSFFGIELNGIYVANLLNTNSKRDIAWTVDFLKPIGDNLVISGLFGEHSHMKVEERVAAKSIYNINYSLKLLPNVELSLMNWNYEPGFDPYFRDRTPPDPDCLEEAGNVLDQWGGTRGNLFLLRTERTPENTEKVAIEKYTDAQGLLRQKIFVEIRRKFVAGDFILSYEEKLKQFDGLSNLNHTTNIVKLELKKNFEAKNFLLTGGTRVGVLLNSKEIYENKLYFSMECRNSILEGLKLSSELWKITDFKKLHTFSLDYSTPGGTRFFIKDRRTSPHFDKSIGLRNPKEAIAYKLIENYFYLGVEKSF